MPLITTHALAMFGLAARRAWLHHVDTESLQGSDRHMLRWCIEEQRRAYAMFHISFGSHEGDFTAIRDQIVADVRADLARPHSDFRRGVSWSTQRYVVRNQLTVEGLVEVVDHDEAFYRIADPEDRELVLRFHTKRRLFGVLFDHTCWDGVRIVNEIVTKAIRSKPFDTKWLAEITYTPLRDEAVQLYTAYAMGYRLLTHTPMITYQRDEDQHVFRHHMRTQDVKDLKDQLRVPFSAALIGIYAQMMFRWMVSSRERVRFGVIVGCVSARFRNNYSIITIDIRRRDRLQDYVRDAAKQLARRRVEVLGLFNLMGSLEVETWFKNNMIDVLFSPAFFDRGEGVSLAVDDMGFFNVPSSVPLYSFACSIGDLITMSSTLNTPELSVEQMSDDAKSVFRYNDQRRLDLVDTPASGPLRIR